MPANVLVDSFPELIFDLGKLRHNTQALVTSAGGVKVFGVTKGCAGSPRVAEAMVRGGVAGLADSRLTHLLELRKRFPEIPLLALRQPMRHEIRPMLEIDATLMVSDLRFAADLASTAADLRRSRLIVLMIEIGDGREGLAPADFDLFLSNLRRWPSLKLAGIAANVGCHGGKHPDAGMLTVLDRLAAAARAAGFSVDIVSAGNSSCWNLLSEGKLPVTTNQIRLGEAILLGRETAEGRAIPGIYQNSATVKAEVLEVAIKDGSEQAVLAIGLQDIGAGTLEPLDKHLKVTRVTSDHCILLAKAGHNVFCGGLVEFLPSYFAMQSLAASPYVRKAYIGYND